MIVDAKQEVISKDIATIKHKEFKLRSALKLDIHVLDLESCDLAHYESLIAQCPSNRYLEGHGFNSRWGLKKLFFWVFRLENASPLYA